MRSSTMMLMRITTMILMRITIMILMRITSMMTPSCRGSTVTGCPLARSFEGSWLLGNPPTLFYYLGINEKIIHNSKISKIYSISDIAKRRLCKSLLHQYERFPKIVQGNMRNGLKLCNIFEIYELSRELWFGAV